MTGVEGDVHVESVNGNLTVRDLAGTASLETANGSVTAEDVRSVAHAEATNGSIDLQVRALDGDATVGTTAGSVTVRLPASERPRLDLHSMLGSVSVQGLPSNRDDAEDRPSLRVSTTTGSIVVGT